MNDPAPEASLPTCDSIWFIYLIRCRHGSLYTGITTDVARRFAEHESGKGAKFLRGKAPLTLVFQQAIGSRSAALMAEAAIKKLSRAEKEHIIQMQAYPALPC